MSPLPTLVFDLDGTLVDTAPDVIGAVNQALTEAGFRAAEPALLRPGMSYGGRKMIEMGLKLQGRALDSAVLDALTKAMLACYKARVAVASTPYPGVRETLSLLEAQGARMAVCTNKLEALSRNLLCQLGLERHFRAICGRDTFPVCKPDPGHLRGSVKMAGGVAEQAIMIGDSEVDIATAKAAGTPVVAVSYGYTDLDMSQLAPNAIITEFSQLPAALAALRS